MLANATSSTPTRTRITSAETIANLAVDRPTRGLDRQPSNPLPARIASISKVARPHRDGARKNEKPGSRISHRKPGTYGPRLNKRVAEGEDRQQPRRRIRLESPGARPPAPAAEAPGRGRVDAPRASRGKGPRRPAATEARGRTGSARRTTTGGRGSPERRINTRYVRCDSAERASSIVGTNCIAASRIARPIASPIISADRQPDGRVTAAHRASIASTT